MNKILIISILVILAHPCVAQDIDYKKRMDSIGLNYRTKADLVLNKFDQLADKILYSLNDKYFHVVIKKEFKIVEYFVTIDKNDKVTIHKIKTKRKESRFLLKVFDFKKYHKNFVTTTDNPKFVRGGLSYFVLKTENNRRFGEYCLPLITVPIPLDAKLLAFLQNKLIIEINSVKIQLKM